ncbi:hypothetical protein NG796_16850 [Laspinema sp. A4]|uniref:hypothetical protein n=1 Tax=Laspinema sp. D2d TaxID=2953686 RepID=UPI0021BB070E|nr:hypothetical protein [Laspinema sp. D2d]MCT7984942.1 hypothetical protein [Laspinema sp. D2d]
MPMNMEETMQPNNDEFALVFKRMDPQDCFYSPRANSILNRYPGWAIAFVELPSSYTEKIYLVRNRLGETCWVDSRCVWFRGDCAEFNSFIGRNFDWSQIERLKQLPIDYKLANICLPEEF